MEKAKFVMPTMNITQGYNEGFHKGTYALDLTGEDRGIDWVKAPFTGTIKQVLNGSYGIWYWFESNEEVKCANGKVTKLVAMFGHDNKVRWKVGDVVRQGDNICAEGTSGNATGNHCHLEIGEGSFVKGGWYKNSNGVYMLYNAVKPNEYLFIDDNTVIKNDYGYKWIYENNRDYSKIKYRGHVEYVGWVNWVKDGETCGTTGESRRLEAIQIDSELDISAKAHLQDIGWINYGKVTKDTIIGTTGESRRLEAISLKGELKYRVHLENDGWTAWTAADGVATLGTVGMSQRIEAIEIIAI